MKISTVSIRRSFNTFVHRHLHSDWLAGGAQAFRYPPSQLSIWNVIFTRLLTAGNILNESYNK